MSVLEFSQIAANYSSVVSLAVSCVTAMVAILTYMDGLDRTSGGFKKT
jgi:hypothetical protein